MTTLGSDDIAAGKASLWPAKTITVREASWAEPAEYQYVVEGAEFWGPDSNDGNLYARATSAAIAERIVACWNAFEGVPTGDIPS